MEVYDIYLLTNFFIILEMNKNTLLFIVARSKSFILVHQGG